MLTLQALMCFEGNDDWNSRTICSCATSSWHLLKRARWKSKFDCIIQLNCGGKHTYASCKTSSNIGELRPPKSIKNSSPFRWTMADCICSSSYFIVSLQIESFMYILHKTSCASGKKEGSTDRSLEELDEETSM